MLSPTNFWMCFAGLVYLAAGVFVLRKEIGSARGWEKPIALGSVFIAVSLAMFAPEHFRGPDYIQQMAPPWMPVHWVWPYVIACALLAAATSLALRKFLRLSTTMLGLMFLLFVCMIYVRGVSRHPANRFAWTFALRDLSFAAGAWALAGLYRRASSPQLSKWMILFARLVIASAAIFYGVLHFLHPNLAPGVPSDLTTPPWVPFPSAWGYLAGGILVAAGICLAVNMKSRMAAASIGALMMILTLFLYGTMLILAHRGSAADFNEAINYFADTLLYAGSALALASALPPYPDRAEKT